MRAKRGRLVCRVNAGVTRLANTLVLGQPQPVRHGPVHPHDPVLDVHNGDQVGNGIEGAIPQAGFRERRAVDLRMLVGSPLLGWLPLVLDSRV